MAPRCFFLMVTIAAALVTAFGVQVRLPCEDARCAAGSRAPSSKSLAVAMQFRRGRCQARPKSRFRARGRFPSREHDHRRWLNLSAGAFGSAVAFAFQHDASCEDRGSRRGEPHLRFVQLGTVSADSTHRLGGGISPYRLTTVPFSPPPAWHPSDSAMIANVPGTVIAVTVNVAQA